MQYVKTQLVTLGYEVMLTKPAYFKILDHGLLRVLNGWAPNLILFIILNLPSNAEENYLKQFFELFGKVEKVVVSKKASSAVGFVHFTERSKQGKKISSSSIQFLTVGERGIVRIWNSDGMVLLYEQKSSDLAVSSENEEVKKVATTVFLQLLQLLSSNRTLKVWSLDGISDNVEEVSNLKSKAVVAAHDKDINSLAITPNDSLVYSGPQDRTSCIWRLPDLVSVVVFKGH
ncbi:hypothetical protein ACS0TY_029761 [Phlomoides rotata]